jgi:SAM dependent carboxyl methyltransferase
MKQKFTEPNHTAMQGDGFYNKNSALQASGISILMPLWLDVCKSVSCVGEPLVIADYASSQGRNSMAPMRIAIDELRKRTTKDAEIEVFHTDLPSNDFSSLFNALQDDENSYMRGITNVFSGAIGRNYFQPLFASGRVHLGWNTFSMQWMSRNPADAPDSMLAGLSQQPDVIAMVKSQQADDWRRFLEVRAHEMRGGAKLLTAFTGKSNNISGWEWLCGELWQAMEDQCKGGLLSTGELRGMTIPIGFRTLDDIKAPFLADGQFAGLELEHAEYLKIPDPFWGDYQISKDRNLIAQRHADLMRAWAAPTLVGFVDPGRNKSELMDDLFARFATRIADAPKMHEPCMVVAILKKRAHRAGL